MHKRFIDFADADETFFLWGPRQVGKSSLLKARFADAHWVDLLRSDLHMKYQSRPHLLREELARHPADKWIVIDEVQKVPALLDEVHWMIENRGFRFALCGSSARKIKRGHANLLGGRALRFELLGRLRFEGNGRRSGAGAGQRVGDGSVGGRRLCSRCFLQTILRRCGHLRGLLLAL